MQMSENLDCLDIGTMIFTEQHAVWGLTQAEHICARTGTIQWLDASLIRSYLSVQRLMTKIVLRRPFVSLLRKWQQLIGWVLCICCFQCVPSGEDYQQPQTRILRWSILYLRPCAFLPHDSQHIKGLYSLTQNGYYSWVFLCYEQNLNMLKRKLKMKLLQKILSLLSP